LGERARRSGPTSDTDRTNSSDPKEEHVAQGPAKPKAFYKKLWVQVLIGMGIGVVLGHVAPETGAAMKPLGDAFIKLIKMIIAPIIFVTVVSGLCKMSNMKEVGRIGVRAVILFEIVSTLAMILGLVVGILVRPGAGLNADPATLDAGAVLPREASSSS
jgi:aerobic C4-dicarboxylate transport protein